MDIKQVVKRRLRQQLADEKALFEARQAAALVEADLIAAKAEVDAEAVARQQAADEQNRTDAVWAEKLERASQAGLGADIGTVATRNLMFAKTGITKSAISRAACGASGNYDDDDLISVKNGVRTYPGEQFVNIISAAMGFYRRSLNAEERKTQEALDKRRAETLAQHADEVMARYEADKELERKLEA